MRITEVKDKYSKAVPVGTLGAVKPGDLIREASSVPSVAGGPPASP